MKKFVKSNLFYVLSFIIVAAISAILPFSHAMDSSVIVDVLNHDGKITGWNAFYMNFYANNKIVAYFYFVFYKLFGNNAALATKFVNFISTYATIFFVAKSARIAFGKDKESTAIVIATLVFPYFINFGPYIYNLSIPLSAICFYLALIKDKKHTIIMLAVLSLLLFIRMTAAVFIFTFLFFRWIFHFREKENFKIFAWAIVVLFAFKYIWGGIFYLTNLHKYPNLTNSAMQWTLFLGTRADGENTGWCVYQPEAKAADNNAIVANFNQLTSLYSQDKKENYESIKELNKTVTKQILERSKATILKNPKNFFSYTYNKTKNLFIAGDKEIYYYYGAHMDSNSLSDELRFNVHSDVRILFSIFVLLFFAAFIWLFLIRMTSIKPIVRKYEVWGSVLGFFATALVFVLSTEVALRYLLDAAVPMMFVIVAAAISLENKWLRRAAEALYVVVIAFLLTQNNLDIPKFNFEVERENNNSIITIKTENDFDEKCNFTISNSSTIYKIEDGNKITVPDGAQLLFHYEEKTRVIYK